VFTKENEQPSFSITFLTYQRIVTNMSSGFVSETELAERRRIRQEEWDKVRTAEQPLGNILVHLHLVILIKKIVLYSGARRAI